MPSSYQNLIENIKSHIAEISIADFILAREKNALRVIDVREAHEVLQGTIPNSLAISRGVLELEIENHIPEKDQNLVVFCASGNRSALAAEALKRLGYQNVFSLTGGFSAWKALNHPVTLPLALKPEQKVRYQRHTNLKEVREEGQNKLLSSRVAIVGMGGLGCPAALYLAAAGIGTLGLFDPDVVELSNLQRQVLFEHSQIGDFKVNCAAHRLAQMNPDIQIKTHAIAIDAKNAFDALQSYDVIVNACDNFATRYVLNDVAFFLNKPLIDGAIMQFRGQCTVYHPPLTPCYRCIFPHAPNPKDAPNCAEAGVLGVVPGVIGTLQGLETLKFLLKTGNSLDGRLLLFDGLTSTFQDVKIDRDSECALCGLHPTITTLGS